MMQIDLPADQQQNLTQQAIAKGFRTAEEYAVSLLGLYAADDDELRRSADALDRSHAQYLNGEGRDAREALRDIAARHNVPFDR